MRHNDQIEVFGCCACKCHERLIHGRYCQCGWLRIFPRDNPRPTRRVLRPGRLDSRVQAFSGTYQRPQSSRVLSAGTGLRPHVQKFKEKWLA